MKKVYSIFVCLCMLAGFVACDKDNDFALTTLTVTNETVTPSYETAEVSCSFKADATISEAYVQYSLSSSFADYEVAKMTEEKGRYTALLTGLVDNTTYYIRYTVSNKFSNVVADAVEEFQTLSCTVPTIVLDSVGGVRESHAKAYLHLTFDGGASVTDIGICWSTEASPTIEDIHKSTKDTAAVLDITNLQENTKYYVRAYAVNRVGTAYSEEVSFTTSKQVVLPTITTAAVTQITETTAVAGGNVTGDGGASVTERGVVYSTNPNPVITNLSNTIRPCGSGMGEFTYTITGLQPSSKYYVRAYAKNDAGTAYGEEVSFTTLSQQPTTQLPTVTTSVATQITATTAVAGGNVTSEGGASVTERGVCIATISNPTTANTKIPAGSGTGEFTCEITGLQEGTKYYIRAYAVNSEGTAYGDEEEFTTAVVTTPTLTTSEVTQITETSAVAGGNVTSDGGAEVTERGVVYSLSATPAINDLSSTIVRSGSGTGVFTCNLTNLQSGTKYFVRAYAVNDKGTAYGEVVSFTTAVPITLATVTTATVSNITENTAVAGGTVTNDGNSSVTDKGVCIATVSNPTTAHTKISAGSGMGTFTCNLTGLQANTKYYIRAYAVNSKGTAYGEELTFTTAKPIVLPTVTTDIVTQISVRTAVAGGNVTSDGNASVTERGVCVATASNPTTSNTKITAGSGTGSFTCNLTGLQPSTTYYVRAYAINSKGTAYGEEVSFTTEEQSSTPNNGTENGHEYVDLGLSVKWATMNVGASSPEGYGDYFAWGETSTKSTYDWSTYKWCNGSDDSLTKYNNSSSYGTVDNTTTLDLSDDAAYVNWGGAWRMPTDAELTELREQCTWTWISQNGVNGYKVTSKSNGNSIFLPAAGCLYGSSLANAGKGGYYWSSSLDTDGPRSAWLVLFNSSNVYRRDCHRNYGTSIRPVLGENEAEVTPPTVTTVTVTQITETTAVAGGNVTSDGGASVTERGVVYSTNTNPVITNLNNTIRPCGSGTGAFTYTMIGLQPSTTYYVRAYAINSKGTAYGEEVSFTTNEEMVDNPPSNLVAMPFSVSAGKQVTFSQGNLQYTQSTDTWSFAENQYDYIGTDNVTGGSVSSDPTQGYSKFGTALADKIDLFGWSTSATNFGVSISMDENDYSGSFVDWGANTICDDAPNTWRTLTKDEWNYLRNTRTNASDLRGVAQVNGVNGLILLPDNWTCPAGITFKSGFHSERGVNYYAAYQTFTAEQWSKLESAGAVFLPAAGYRYGLDVIYVQYCGLCWSATEYDSNDAYYLGFRSDGSYMISLNRSHGRSVRLVKDL